jgi:hypothetical protein
MPFVDIATKLAELSKFDKLKDFGVSLRKKVIGTEEKYDPYDGEYTANIYGDPASVEIRFVSENPDYYDEYTPYKKHLNEWSRRMEARRLREAEIKLVKQGNRELMNRARDEHRELWISAARHLKGKPDSGWLVKRARELREKLTEVEALLEKEQREYIKEVL